MLPLRDLSADAIIGKAFGMGDPTSKKLSREDRLAAKLRENLRRRKAQARGLAPAIDSESGESGLPKPGDAG
ncbi:hypothetical protein U4960_01140 [Altererythrobacter sp. H2]|uniref:hypothetical protein n=1 Tax=Altererythrobacter sp. H2 TaxID=3108391 RepID=UPI002B4BFC64|nr:hypothetical protein [Altererythrobacter sp. H2]WRK95964.1 hypothetical protein U4960_01140 [Altererythrobacter sp. H2]